MHRKIITLFLILCAFYLGAEELPALKTMMDFQVDDYLASMNEQNADAVRLNTLGFQAYKAGDLYKAAKLWWCSLKKDDSYVWPHYNYACVLSLFAASFGRDPAEIIYAVDGSPEIDLLFAYTDHIFTHLKKAISLKPSLKKTMEEDADLDLIRNMIEYKMIRLYPDYDPIILLTMTDFWYGSNRGAYPGGTIQIEGNNIIIEDITLDDTMQIQPIIKEGTITAEGYHLIIEITKPEKEILDGKINVIKDEYGYITAFWLECNGTHYSMTPDLSA